MEVIETHVYTNKTLFSSITALEKGGSKLEKIGTKKLVWHKYRGKINSHTIPR